MSRKYLMTWELKRRRWAKMYKGQRYTVTPAALSAKYAVPVPETKDGSYTLANEWWKEKKAALDAENRSHQRQPHPMEDYFDAWLGLPLEMGLDPTISGPPEHAKAMMREFLGDMLLNHVLDGEPIPEEMAKILSPARVQQIEESFKGLRGEATAAPDRTVQAHVEGWRVSQQARVDGGQLTAARLNNALICLRHFEQFMGSGSNVDGVNERALEGFYTYCLKRAGGEWSVPYAKEAFSVTRGFVRWLWRQGTIEQLPRNIDSRDWRFGSTAKIIEVWTAVEYKLAVDKAPGNFKLALLLMGNCGMRQKDVSDLLDTEVDWKSGRITRKRSKTRSHKNVPTVSYKLWPVTFDLLRQYRSGKDHVLLTESGRPYVRSESKQDSRAKRADGFTSRWAHLKKQLRKELPDFRRDLKGIRATGASQLGQHETYGRFAQLYLGHSPRTVADRHYVVPSQDLFDKAVAWLGQQLGQVPVEDKQANPARPTKGRKKLPSDSADQ